MRGIPDRGLRTRYSCHPRTCYYGRLNHRMRWLSLRCHVRSWQAAYRTLFPDDYLDQLRPEDRAHRYDFAGHDPLKPRTIVAVEEGLIHGFATTAPARGPDLGDCGELWALHVDPAKWGHGTGVASSCPTCRTRVSQGGPVGPGGERACGALLPSGWMGVWRGEPDRLSVGPNRQRGPVQTRA
jgi:GNAT superfamily N-acetyltransferase